MSSNGPTKTEIVEHIKEWISIDIELKRNQKAAKDLRAKKKHYTTRLVDIMRTNEIDCFDVKDGKLLYTKTKTRGPLGKKHLHAALDAYFKNNDSVATSELTAFILDSRQINENETVRMK